MLRPYFVCFIHGSTLQWLRQPWAGHMLRHLPHTLVWVPVLLLNCRPTECNLPSPTLCCDLFLCSTLSYIRWMKRSVSKLLNIPNHFYLSCPFAPPQTSLICNLFRFISLETQKSGGGDVMSWLLCIPRCSNLGHRPISAHVCWYVVSCCYDTRPYATLAVRNTYKNTVRGPRVFHYESE